MNIKKATEIGARPFDVAEWDAEQKAFYRPLAGYDALAVNDEWFAFNDKTLTREERFRAAFNVAKRALVDENGEAIYFNSIIGAMNYMSERGWMFMYEQKNYSQSVLDRDNISVSTTLIFSKQVTAPEQITEGICTRQMLREQNAE